MTAVMAQMFAGREPLNEETAFDIEFTEQIARLVIPHPPHVMGNLIQTFQFFRQCSLYSQSPPLGSIGIVCFNLHNLTGF